MSKPAEVTNLATWSLATRHRKPPLAAEALVKVQTIRGEPLLQAEVGRGEIVFWIEDYTMFT